MKIMYGLIKISLNLQLYSNFFQFPIAIPQLPESPRNKNWWRIDIPTAPPPWPLGSYSPGL